MPTIQNKLHGHNKKYIACSQYEENCTLTIQGVLHACKTKYIKLTIQMHYMLTIQSTLHAPYIKCIACSQYKMQCMHIVQSTLDTRNTGCIACSQYKVLCMLAFHPSNTNCITCLQ